MCCSRRVLDLLSGHVEGDQRLPNGGDVVGLGVPGSRQTLTIADLVTRKLARATDIHEGQLAAAGLRAPLDGIGDGSAIGVSMPRFPLESPVTSAATVPTTFRRSARRACATFVENRGLRRIRGGGAIDDDVLGAQARPDDVVESSC